MLGWVGLIALELVSLVVFIELWLTKAALWRKLGWSPIVWIPVLGPLFYLGLFGGMPSRYRDAAFVHTKMGPFDRPLGPLARAFQRLLRGG